MLVSLHISYHAYRRAFCCIASWLFGHIFSLMNRQPPTERHRAPSLLTLITHFTRLPALLFAPTPSLLILPVNHFFSIGHVVVFLLVGLDMRFHFSFSDLYETEILAGRVTRGLLGFVEHIALKKLLHRKVVNVSFVLYNTQRDFHPLWVLVLSEHFSDVFLVELGAFAFLGN